MTQTEWEYLTPVHTDYVLPECQELLMHWQKVMDKEQQIDGRERWVTLDTQGFFFFSFELFQKLHSSQFTAHLFQTPRSLLELFEY